MKHTKKLAALLAVLLTASAILCSCGTTNEPSDETKDNGQASNTPVTENETRETLDIPDIRHDGTELCFLTRGGTSGWSTTEIFSEGITSESGNVSNAVYERNDRILQDYGVTVLELRKEVAEHATAVRNEVAAPSGDFQAIITEIPTQVSLATNGQLWDLNHDAMEYIDFTKPWWDGKMAEGMSICDRLYFATGDLLVSDNDATFILTFNKTLAKEYQIPDLYTLVENGEWTMDKMIELESQCKSDLNGDGKLTYDTDVCGFAYTGNAAHVILVGGDITMCAKTEDDIPIYALDVEGTQNIADKGQLIFDKEYTMDLDAEVAASGKPIEEVGNIAFAGNHALFYSECMLTVSHLRSYDVDFGIIPNPKFNKEQAHYSSMMHSISSMVSIPRSLTEDDLDMVTSMIEAMAYHAVDTLTEQYYEINLKTKTAKDEQSGPMLDMILADRVCDLAYYYQWGGNAFDSIAKCLLPGSGRSVASQSQKFKTTIEKNIDRLITTMEKNENK